MDLYSSSPTLTDGKTITSSKAFCFSTYYKDPLSMTNQPVSLAWHWRFFISWPQYLSSPSLWPLQLYYLNVLQNSILLMSIFFHPWLSGKVLFNFQHSAWTLPFSTFSGLPTCVPLHLDILLLLLPICTVLAGVCFCLFYLNVSSSSILYTYFIFLFLRSKPQFNRCLEQK
jgi:hypothetical protein